MGAKTIVYILRSKSNLSRYYTGNTSDMARRMAWHNAGENVSTAE